MACAELEDISAARCRGYTGNCAPSLGDGHVVVLYPSEDQADNADKTLTCDEVVVDILLEFTAGWFASRLGSAS